ncbi:hypothetical protein [Occultella kanbiaonis]|uniref:hypothetical protein n=1 Tax=Occultella kanbiaonis TaxID=2675754 RepID=UPI0012BA28AE|nr:hypothetical protein [Occultella kanbiaonis]
MSEGGEFLGIAPPADLRRRWRNWFAPARQPFRLDRVDARILPPDAPLELRPGPEIRDTFHLYDGDWVWLTQDEYTSLALATRRALLFGREALGRLGDQTPVVRDAVGAERTDSRIVWWPSLLRVAGYAPILRYIEEEVAPSRHGDVLEATWLRARDVLPRARDLAGTFAPGSGPNCFGTVMAAAGVPGAEHEWMFQDPFEQWLTAHTVPVAGAGWDAEPGIVLVWRDRDGLAGHAAVSIGSGMALSKPSQSWSSPRVIWTVRETIRAARHPGLTLSRRRIR